MQEEYLESRSTFNSCDSNLSNKGAPRSFDLSPNDRIRMTVNYSYPRVSSSRTFAGALSFGPKFISSPSFTAVTRTLPMGSRVGPFHNIWWFLAESRFRFVTLGMKVLS
ncbi:hypothetical protein M378DRAFT_157567 [Amanita muscaria Koide BX008]|uniref:Uncharacterized protein n=1 Tax=Amanita muscaria (strain Koide BX008) TaxID=946122 RepID=A0A0C2TQ00_AMAMK|nr:hypothetical protein M378DRAFT_157567 [Amanita muscaria Koide BX008]